MLIKKIILLKLSTTSEINNSSIKDELIISGTLKPLNLSGGDIGVSLSRMISATKRWTVSKNYI